jgi:adenine-specific DNA methylase
VSIETKFDIPFVASLALREKQIQQNYRPIIAVHKWFARRPGTLFRALALAEFGNAPLSDLFYEANEFFGRTIADPFMGGGTPLIEAHRVGCDVTGIDINPMSAWIVREEIEYLDIDSYTDEALCLISNLRSVIQDYYLTETASSWVWS